MRITEILCGFRAVLDSRKTGKETSESSRLDFLERFLANTFVFSAPEDKTSRLLNRGGIADFPLLRTLLTICQKSQEPKLWEVMDFSVLLGHASLAASRILSQ